MSAGKVHAGTTECRPCVECAVGEHHFSDAMIAFAFAEPEHPAAQAEHAVWFVCKHCNAWAEDEF